MSILPFKKKGSQKSESQKIETKVEEKSDLLFKIQKQEYDVLKNLIMYQNYF